MNKRFKLDGLCEALGYKVDADSAKPIKRIGAGVAKARANRMAKAIATRRRRSEQEEHK